MERSKTLLNNIIEASILIVLFVIPFSKSAVEIFVTVSIAAFLLKKIFIDKNIRVGLNKNIIITLCLFVLFNLLSLINSQFMHLSIHAFFSKVLKWALFFIVVADSVRTEEQFRRVMVTMISSAFLILADAVYQYYVTGIDFLHFPKGYPVFKFHARKEGGTSFPTASFPYPNDFATWINVYLFTFIASAVLNMKKRPVMRVTVIVLSAILAFFLFLTTTSGALLGALAAAVLFTLINIRKFLLPIAILFLVVILVIVAVPYLRVYLQKGVLDKALSINDRMDMWSVGWQIYRQHPVLGNGVNTFFENFKKYRRDEWKDKKGSYAHNCPLQMAADTGALGLAAFLSFTFFVLYSGIRSAVKGLPEFRSSVIIGISLGVIAFFVHSFFDTNLYSLNLAALFWLTIGLAGSCGIKK